MTNLLALILGLLLLAGIGLDIFLYGSEHMIFLTKRLFALTEWMAFWR